MDQKGFHQQENGSRVTDNQQSGGGHPAGSAEASRGGFFGKLARSAQRISRALSVKDEFRVADDETPAESLAQTISSEESEAHFQEESASGPETAAPEEPLSSMEPGALPEQEGSSRAEPEDESPARDDEPDREPKEGVIGRLLGSLFKKASPPAPDQASPEPAGNEDGDEEENIAGQEQPIEPENHEPASADEDSQEYLEPGAEGEQGAAISPETLPEPISSQEPPADSAIPSPGLLSRIFHRQEKPIDQVLEIKKLEKNFLDSQIKQRRKDQAKLLRKIRRSKKERKSILDSLDKYRGRLKETIATMKAREADVKTLEKQSLSLQGEIEKDSIRQVKLSQDNLASQAELDRLRQEISDTERRSTNSIAVLPFANMSPDPEQEYFCEGIAEELINGVEFDGVSFRALRDIVLTSDDYYVHNFYQSGPLFYNRADVPAAIITPSIPTYLYQP